MRWLWLSSLRRPLTLKSRLLQGLKISKISGFVSGRGQTSPLPGLGRLPARLIHDLEQPSGGSSIGKHSHEGFDDILERLACQQWVGAKRSAYHPTDAPKKLDPGIHPWSPRPDGPPSTPLGRLRFASSRGGLLGSRLALDSRLFKDAS